MKKVGKRRRRTDSGRAKVATREIIMRVVGELPGVRVKSLILNTNAKLRLGLPGSSFDLDLEIPYERADDAPSMITEAVERWRSMTSG